MSEINWKKYGHTYEEHVNVTDKDLIDRLLYGTYDIGKYMDDRRSICTRFLSEEIAFKSIERALKIRTDEIQEWMKLGYQAKLEIMVNFTSQIGVGYAKGTSWKEPYPMFKVRVILKADAHFREYSIVTAYPIPNKQISQKIAADRSAYYAARRNR